MEDVLTNIITISSNSPEIQNAAQTAVGNVVNFI